MPAAGKQGGQDFYGDTLDVQTANINKDLSVGGTTTHYGPIVAPSVTVVGPNSPYAALLADGVTPTPPGVSTGKSYDQGGEVYNVKAWNAKGDGVIDVTGAIGNGTPNFTAAAGNTFAAFTVLDVGKLIVIYGAGAAGIPLVTTISAFVSATAVTLAANASSTVSNATFAYGTNDTAAIAATIAAAGTVNQPPTVATAGPVVLFPKGIYLINASLTPKSYQTWWGYGASLQWAGAPTSNMIYNGIPAAGSCLGRFGIVGLELNANNVANVSGIYLNSWQGGFLEDVYIQGLKGSAPTSALRMEANSGTTSANNTAFNTIRNLWISQAPIGIRMAAREGGGSNIYSTDNVFIGVSIQGISYAGIDFIQWCDSNWWNGVLVQVNAQVTGATGGGVIFNDSTTPNVFMGVYNQRFFGLSFDCNTGNAGYPLWMNNTWENVIEGLYITGNPTGVVNDTNGATNAGSYEVLYLTAASNTMSRLSKGTDLDMAYTGNVPSKIKIGNLGSDSPPTNPGAVRFLGAGGVSNYGGYEFESSAFGSGYGWKVAAPDDGSHSLIFLQRQNNAAWTEVARFDGTAGVGQLKLLSTVAALNNIATQGMGVPAIQQAPAPLLAQTAAVASVATLTSPNDGVRHVYRVSGTVRIGVLGSANINLQVTYTDSGGTARTCNIPLCAQAGAYVASATTLDDYKGIVEITVNPNTVITILTAGTFTSATYNVSGQIEQVL